MWFPGDGAAGRFLAPPSGNMPAMNPRSTLFVLGLLFAASPLAARELACTSRQDLDHEGYLAAAVRMDIAGDAPRKVALESVSFLDSRNVGYTCAAEFDRSSPRETWNDSAGRLTITAPFEESGDDSTLVINAGRKGYLIDLRQLSDHYCGARVRWPVSIFVPKRGGRCVTKYAS